VRARRAQRPTSAHHARCPPHPTAAQEGSMETIIGIALVVISALEIVWFVRVVSANLKLG
jgi:hypothetical protein